MIKSIESDALKYYKTFYAPKGLEYINLILNNKDHSNSFVKNRGASTVIFDNQDDELRGKDLYEAVVARPDAYKELLNTWFKTKLGEEYIKPTFIDTTNDAQSILNILNDLELSNELGKYKTTCEAISENPVLWNEVCTLDNSNIIKKNVDDVTYTNHMGGDVSNTKTILKAMNKDYTAYDSRIALLNNNTLWNECITYNPEWMGNCIGNNLLVEETVFKNTIAHNDIFANTYISNYSDFILNNDNISKDVYHIHTEFAKQGTLNNTNTLKPYNYPYKVGAGGVNLISKIVYNYTGDKYAYAYVNESYKLIVVIVDVKTNTYKTYCQTSWTSNTPHPINSSYNNQKHTPDCIFLANGNLAVCLGCGERINSYTSSAQKPTVYTFDDQAQLLHTWQNSTIGDITSNQNTNTHNISHLIAVGNNVLLPVLHYLAFLDTDSDAAGVTSDTYSHIYVEDDTHFYRLTCNSTNGSASTVVLRAYTVNKTGHTCSVNNTNIYTFRNAYSSSGGYLVRILTVDDNYIYAIIAGGARYASDTSYYWGEYKYVRIAKSTHVMTVIKTIYDIFNNTYGAQATFYDSARYCFINHNGCLNNNRYVILPRFIYSSDTLTRVDWYLCYTETGEFILDQPLNVSETSSIYYPLKQSTKINVTPTYYNKHVVLLDISDKSYNDSTSRPNDARYNTNVLFF